MADQQFKDVFRYCPVCGQESNKSPEIPFVCSSCGFHFYFPPTIAVGAVISDHQGRVLFIQRAKDPGKGKLGLPGGFVDCGETGEAAVVREINEEVGLVAKQVEYLATFPNVYHYKGIINDVLDIFYVCQVESFDDLRIDKSEVDSFCVEKPEEKIYQRMAFESNVRAVKTFAEKMLGH